ncbi:MAG: ATP-dependent zinc protease, partial [Erythrobacter sp.]|nr:ATP-dependent zinc protease [Erythrobacter sp.]
MPKNIRKNQIKAKKSAVEKIVLGRIEWITIGAKNMRLKARVDTGAQTSSLHAENVVEKTIDGKK